MNNEEKFITIADEEGNEVLAEVIFTFVNDDENFVFLTLIDEFDEVDSIEDDYNVLVYKYEELEDGTIGNLIEIEEDDQATWDIVAEVFETFEQTDFEL